MSASNRQSPSVTMSSPATSCSCRYTDRASTYCSRNRDSTIASRNDRVPRFSVYQLGRGSEPVIVVGSMIPAVAFNMYRFPYAQWKSRKVEEVESEVEQVEEVETRRSRGEAARQLFHLSTSSTLHLALRACDFLAHQRRALGQRVELHLRHHARQRFH